MRRVIVDFLEAGCTAPVVHRSVHSLITRGQESLQFCMKRTLKAHPKLALSQTLAMEQLFSATNLRFWPVTDSKWTDVTQQTVSREMKTLCKLVPRQQWLVSRRSLNVKVQTYSHSENCYAPQYVLPFKLISKAEELPWVHWVNCNLSSGEVHMHTFTVIWAGIYLSLFDHSTPIQSNFNHLTQIPSVFAQGEYFNGPNLGSRSKVSFSKPMSSGNSAVFHI